MTQASRTSLRGFFRTQQFPIFALVLTIIAWIGLASWRPILSGDDWGFYDSVTHTIAEGRPIVSDWLAPSTVGLTVPAAGMALLVGDLWIGSMALMGAFGVLGLVALWLLLRRLDVRPAQIALTILVVGFFPIYLGKWTRFESSLPSVSLLLTTLALLVRVFIPNDKSRHAWRYTLGASLCVAWAIAIRQNHVAVVGVGALGLLLMPGVRQRALLLAIWVLPTLLTFIALRLGVPPSFSQRTALIDAVISRFSAIGYLAALFRALCCSSGMAMLLVLLIAPRTVIDAARRMTRAEWLIGFASVGALLLYAAQRPSWLIPDTDILALVLVRNTLLITIVVVGGLCWWPIVSSALRSPTIWLASGLVLLAAGYLVLAAAWGYWEYYLLEPILLLMIVLLMCAPIRAAQDAQPVAPIRRAARVSPGRFAWLAMLAIYIMLSWNIQRMSNDAQTTELQVMEHAFRDRIAVPADIDLIPFGLAGWSLFPRQIERWTAAPHGFSLAFWELQAPDPAVNFRWGECASAGSEQAGERVLRAGTAWIGFQQQCWSLVQLTAHKSATAVITDYRYLPLTSSEWQQMLAQHANL